MISVKEDFARMMMEIVQEKIKAEQISKMNLTLVDVIAIISILFLNNKKHDILIRYSDDFHAKSLTYYYTKTYLKHIGSVCC